MIGTSLGHYRIVGELGRGGMGIVYRAEDTKLERTVAIKVLPSNALTNEEDRTRFYREAKAAAQLNHPNIAAIHQIDEAVPEGSAPGTGPSPFIAMEFIDGQPLDARIRERPLPLDETIGMAKAVASALQAAHEKNIVHRDIKSANVMLTARGEPKVLDFGLAKTTHSTMLTRMGSTLGTVAYMSPEQARGEEVDARTDLWSLGVVIYEMITGTVPFSTDYEQAAVYSILNEDPEPPTAMRSGVPMELERIVMKLLAKDRKHRYQTAVDLIADLEALDLRNPSGQTTHRTVALPGPSPSKGPLSQRTRITALALAGLLLLFAGWWLGRSGSDSREVDNSARYASVMVPGMTEISHPSISQDSRYMSFSTNRSALWLYDFSDGSLRSLDSGGDIRLNSFSTDGRWLAYEARGSNVYIAQLPDGPSSLLVSGAVLPEWIDDTWLLISDQMESGLDRYNRVTGERLPVYRASDTRPAITQANMLPDGRRALVTVMTAPDRKVGLLDLDDGELTDLVNDAFAPRYLDSGHIVFSKPSGGDTSFEGDVHVQPFDLSSGRMRGQSVRVLGDRGYWEFDVNHHGDLVTSVALDGEVQQLERDLYLYDLETANSTDTDIDLPLSASSVWLTRDAEWLLYVDQEEEQIRFGRLADRRFSPIPNIQAPILNALLSDDDEWVYYTRGQVGNGLAVNRHKLDGSGISEELDFGLARHELLKDVRGDHEFLIAAFESVGSGGTLHYVNTETGENVVIASGTPQEGSQFSPDGKWIAWFSRDGQGNDRLYISGIHGEGPWLIAEGGMWPQWKEDGTGLYFFGMEAMMYTDISTARGVRAVGEIQEVVRYQGDPYYALRRGEHVMAMMDRPNFRVQESPALDVVFNWGDRLKQLAPIE